MNPLISVVIPTYNHAHFLKFSLASVIQQTYSNWEAIVIDNHSSDDTEEVIKAFGDSRIRLLKIRNNGIIAASRNQGIREAKGDWVSFLDSDDLWSLNKLERVVSEILGSKDHIDVLCNNEDMVYIGTKERTLLTYGPYEKDFYRTMLFYGNRLSTSATTIRRTFLIENGLAFNEKPEFVTVEDYDLWLRLAKANAGFLFIPEVLGEYTIHGSNQSASLERHLNNLENLIRYHIFEIQEFDSNKEALWNKFLVRLKFDKGFVFLRERKPLYAIAFLVGAFFGSPSVFMDLLKTKFKNRIGRS
ncbi:glycosyltransferase [Leptospira yasudae]|uniref:glycosyltransferase n=1 Tax=Leptospira yasudae TaxID=2202201 RepID=UPI001083C69B|nr:glycosyltransferase [Leptospira yasudae]TGK24531.1 glycosyltransferase [Leptospira yasudae]TGM05683.1 glycosyltransferase [Leptospira yasudae]